MLMVTVALSSNVSVLAVASPADKLATLSATVKVVGILAPVSAFSATASATVPTPVATVIPVVVSATEPALSSSRFAKLSATERLASASLAVPNLFTRLLTCATVSAALSVSETAVADEVTSELAASRLVSVSAST